MGWKNPVAILALAALSCGSALFAEKVTLSVWTNVTEEHKNILAAIADDFMAQNPGIAVEFNAPGQNHENMMKVRMAANDLPDLFSTHGWAKARYGTFLADLSGRPWARQVSDSIRPIVTDTKGKLYVLPFDSDITGPVYNTEIFDRYHIAVPTTLGGLLAACETIKTQSKGSITPIAVSAAGWVEAEFFEFFATPFYISAPGSAFGESFRNGSFDWKRWEEISQVWLDMKNRGYLSHDPLTTTYEDNIRAFASGKVAIGFFGAFMISEAKKLNPDIKMDMFPIPAVRKGDSPSWVGGEKTTFGVWKGSRHLKEAMMLIDFYARPQNVAKVAAFTQLPPGLKNVPMDAGEMTATYARYAAVPIFPYFDREYLPSGMWDVMCKTSLALLAGATDPRKAAARMGSEFLRLRSIKE